ncbi:MAG: D-alanyl-D-alanine carboxypeptidase, partial [Pseudomonadota bacterium]
MFRIGYALLFFVFLAFSAEAGIKDRVKRLAPNGLVFVLDEKGKTLVSQNANKPFVPASVAKIVTAWLALEVLGEDYRFETKFYMDTNRVLYVRGSGDPYLVSEELALLAPELLKATGKKPFTAMVLDTSYYPQGLTIPGIENDDEAYNALNSALAVNFNTIHARRKGKS